MRDQVIAACAELELQPPFDMDRLAAKIAGAREYVIEIEPQPMTGQALWGEVHPFGDIFIIYYRADASKSQRERIICHELAHIWLRHVTPDSRKVMRRGELTFLTSPKQELEAEEWAKEMVRYAQIVTGGALMQDLSVEGGKPASGFRKSLGYLEW
jgi:hypothetical protein